ncbi:MAG TPA: pyridoxamine 5'-phosphate oxidase family protein [Chloroflexota bacterium]|nr:pyridoxamine 5'-phosphate oxidase family protein [Chloroflexota bacterium]
MSDINQSSDATEPRRSRPSIHPSYGIPNDESGLLPWSWVTERLENEPLIWMSTTRPNGRPHVKPVWGVYVDDTLYIETGPVSRGGRNLASNPAIAVHVQRGEDVVIVEGEAEPAFALPPDSAARIAAAVDRKYGKSGYHPTPEQYERDGSGLYRIRPRAVFAWSDFLKDPTRWVFEGERG